MPDSDLDEYAELLLVVEEAVSKASKSGKFRWTWLHLQVVDIEAM